MILIWILTLLTVILILSYQRASLSVVTIAVSTLLLVLSVLVSLNAFILAIVWIIWILLACFLNIKPLRRHLFSKRICHKLTGHLPKISLTEQIALEVGDIGWEAELLSGRPDWNHLQAMPWVTLSDEEAAFLQGPVEQLCGLIDSWAMSRRMQIPDNIWEHLKKEGYFGLVIPTVYGGKGFSAFAHAQIILKVASVNTAVGTVVAVPNSLGPAELLLRYGTDEQKNHYLPRLASGEEIPCFALTSTFAGSDASSMKDYGVVYRDMSDNKPTLRIRLNWDKRYITLAPVATLMGLAFKLYDPDHLLGDAVNLGITCALVPVNTPGVCVGRRHYPLDCAFPNGPTQGVDVSIPLESGVIGGQTQVGQGWSMLMETLAAGRAISLPSIAIGSAQRIVACTGAYARIRRQFKTYIGHFGGVKEALTRIHADFYMADALRLFGLAQLDNGIQSVTLAAISKLHTTELGRSIAHHAMDIYGGKGICMGPNNDLAQSHIQSPIAITVEGANILTRSLIIFGQGILRCHPYLLKELKSINTENINEFDRLLFSHLGYLYNNKVSAFFLGIRTGLLTPKRLTEKQLMRYLSRFSACFVFITDVLVAMIGHQLKRYENLSARLGDLLSYLYMMTAILKYNQENKIDLHHSEQGVVAQWCCQELLYSFQEKLDQLLQNLPNRWFALPLRCVVFPLGRRIKRPDDRLSDKVADALMTPGFARDRLLRGIYSNKNGQDLLLNEVCLKQIINAEALLIKRYHFEQKNPLQSQAFEKQLSSQEAEQLLAAEKLIADIVKVDDFKVTDDGQWVSE